MTRQDNVVIVGLDPEKAFLGDHPLFQFEWVAGNPAEAVRLMKQGRACVAPDHFLVESGLKIGDTFSLVPPENADKPVRYTIAGSVRMPGWHWQTKMTGFRTRTHRAAALLFADYPSVAADFDLPAASYVWFSYGSPNADPGRIAEAAQSLYSDTLKRDVAIGAHADGRPSVRAMPVEDIRNMIRGAAKRWIWVISQIPLVSLAIAGLGVLSVILASVRARRWELGVLRALGFTRWTLVRAVLAEGLLIGSVAAVLSMGFGVLAGWCGCGMAQYFSFFGGLHPSLVIPWASVSLGLAALLALTLLAAVWPAVSVGKSPRSLFYNRTGPCTSEPIQ